MAAPDVTGPTDAPATKPRAFTSRFGVWLAVIAGLGFLARVGYLAIIGPKLVLGADSIWYRLQAATIADGPGYVNGGELLAHARVVPTAQFPPLWPALLSVIDLFGGTEDWTFQLAGVLAGTATIVLAGFLGRRLAGGAVGLATAALVAISPSLIAADGSLMSESLFVALMTLALLVAVRAKDADRLWWWAALGGALALATLTRSDALLLAPFVVVATGLGASTLSSGRRWAGIGISALALVVVLAPWVISRSTALDAPILVSSNSGSLLEGANCEQTYSGADLGLWTGACLTPPRARPLPEATTAANSRQRGIDYATDHVERLPLVGAVRVLRLWGLYDPINQARGEETVESRQPDWQVVAWAAFLAMLVFAVVGFVRSWTRRARFAPLLGVILGVTFVGLVSWGNQRFRLAAEPAIAVYAAVAFVALLGRWSSRGGSSRGGSSDSEAAVAADA